MKKKILCFILAVILLLGSLPLTAFANEARAENTALPAFKITSQYSEKIPNSDEVIAIPDENGVFILTIFLTKELQRPNKVHVFYEIENATAVVGTAMTDDGKVENGDFFGAFVEPKYHTSNVTEEQHYGTSGKLWFPYTVSSVQIKIYSNTELTDGDKTFKIRLTGVDNTGRATISETENEITCRLRNAPVARVSSMYSQQGRAVPDENGFFYFDISLDRFPKVPKEYLVYYRTIDDSAVSQWGDYKSVGSLEDTYVTLNAANNYTARVVVESRLVNDAFYEYWYQENAAEYVYSRKFIFDLRYIEGDAILMKNSNENSSELDCHLRANRYHPQNSEGEVYVTHSTIVSLVDEKSITTPWCEKKSEYKADINISFPDYFKNFAQAGFSDVGVAIYGSCFEDWWNSDGPATFHLYYTFEGKTKKALSLYMEGEFDDSTFFGWELAFDYMRGYYGRDGVNVDDYMEDNFIGFTIYDNDEKVAFTTLTDDGQKGSMTSIREKLQQAIQQGYAVQNDTPYYGGFHPYAHVSNHHLYYLKLPSDFIYADSYEYKFASDTDDHKRRLDHVGISFYLMGTDAPKIATDQNGKQMVATNIEQLKEGDPLRMSIRFDQPVNVHDVYNDFRITALINGQYPVALYYTGSKYALDTMVFECELPEEVKNIKIHSLTSIQIDYGSSSGINSFIANKALYSTKIYDLNQEYDGDLRVPVATVSSTGTNSWKKSESVDVYVWDETKKTRFMDYVTVYYQWSTDKETPETYSSRLVFHTAKDKEVVKTIVGTGNGEMFLHLKTVSRYGKETVSEPLGPYKFDNTAPVLSKENGFSITGSLKAPTITVYEPIDDAGWQIIQLYRSNETKPFKTLEPQDFKGKPEYSFTIKAEDVGVGINGMERKDIDFYWVLSDRLNNVSDPIEFTVTFDTNDYLNSEELTSFGPYDFSDGTATYVSTTEKLDSLTYIYDYTKNQGKINGTHSSGKSVYYGFYFQINQEAFGGDAEGNYTVKVTYQGTPVTDVTVEPINADGLYAVWFHQAMESGRYELQLVRTQDESTRVSERFSIYATEGENDSTPTKNKVDTGTLLINTVYQLATDFYYLDEGGFLKTKPYNNTKQPASFSSIAKAKEYAYYMELHDIYLVQLTSITASALNSETQGAVYRKAQGEKTVAQAGDYWIRYKSATWESASTANAWVYYYYGKSGDLNEFSLSDNLKNALNTVANRIVSYGKSVILTDTSLLLGSSAGDKMLDKYGMPYLLEGQVHAVDESSSQTVCGSVWSIPVLYAADKNIYQSNVHIGEGGIDEYEEYPIIGNFAVPTTSRFQYMAYGEYINGEKQWSALDLKKGQCFIDFFTESGIYYIREISEEGVSVYPICIDKAAPIVDFYNYDSSGNRNEILVDGFQIKEIEAKDIIIGSVSDTDNLSYVAVYNSQLKLVTMHTADEIETAPIKLENGKYYIVVSDRSGNHYTVTAKVSNTPLECQIKESPDRFIRLTCNRKSDEILRYEVYLNGQLVTSTYSADQNFTSAGTYRIIIQDIYNNIYAPEEYVFHRNYPEITWDYRGSDGKYHTYNPKNSEASGFVMTQIADNQYKISTSVETRFSFTGNYKFEFIGTAPKYTPSPTNSSMITIEAGQSFTLKVYYRDYAENYVIFSGVVDITPPTVNISAEINVSSNGEYLLFNQWLKDGKIGDVIDLKELYYTVEKDRKTVTNGETVSSDFIRIDVSDANDLYFVEVYLDGELIRWQDSKTGFSQIVVSRWGVYRIVAKDALGNVSEVTFTNGEPNNFDYYVDGVKKDLEMNAHLNFEMIDGKMGYTISDYGNSEFKLDIKKNADIFLSVGVTDGATKIYGFRIENGSVYPLVYTIVEKLNEARIELHIGAPFILTESEDFVANKEYLLNNDGLYEIYASVSNEKIVTIKVYASKDASKIVSINARLEFSDEHTTFVSAKLSKKCSEVIFRDPDGAEIHGFKSPTDIRLKKSFTIDESLFEAEYVADIRLYYSNLNNLDIDHLYNKINVYESGQHYETEGFYLLVVTNRFGNETVYRITISRSFGITSSVTFVDGQKLYYSKDYNGKLYSNNEIILDMFDEDVNYTVTMNGVEYKGFVEREEDDVLYLVFSQEGIYEVTLTDSYGNVIVKQLEIKKSSYTVSDDLLTGYNEKALKRNEGYTNQRLSVNQEACNRDGLCYLAIQYKDTLTVLLDAFAEIPVTLEAEDLIDAVGAYGDGIYTVICRNRYGAVATKEIHYRSTPTLKLERNTRSKTEPETYDLNYAVLLGFWSNNALMFSTEAQTYVFTINGDVTECPRTLVFESSGELGNFEYEITYVDEYGFEYRFKAYLVRQNIAINLPSNVTGVEVDGVLNTKHDLSITFAENCYATYTRNNGEEVAYLSGTVLKQDGVYRFTVTDFAGNVSTMTIKKDTIVEFAFLDSDSGTVVQNGSVVNTLKIGFDALNKDSAYIEKVMLNGVLQTDFTGTKFDKNGKWEVLLSDKLGNKAYFCFYVITHSQNGFAYTTPYEYHITEMWYDAGDGVKVSYMGFVNHTDFTSSFNFKENGKYTVVMISDVTGLASTFEFTVNTSAPEVSLVGCNIGETTINDVSITGCKIGDRIMIYREIENGEELVEQIEVTSLSTKMPTITEGGKYRIVVESEAGVATELTFVRKHVMNTAGSIFIMVVIGLCVVGLFTGLVYRNKSKTDE